MSASRVSFDENVDMVVWWIPSKKCFEKTIFEDANFCDGASKLDDLKTTFV